MPLQIAPFFRSLQIKVLEPSGIYKTLNSLGYTTLRAEEVAGTAPAPPSSLFKSVIPGAGVGDGVPVTLTLP